MEPQQEDSKRPSDDHILQTQLRIDEIVDKLLLKWRRSEICRKYSKEWNLSYRQVDEYISWAKKEIHSYIIPATPELIKERIQEYDKLYRLSLSSSQYSVAKQILKDKSELEGLLIQRIDHTTNGKDIQQINIIVKNIEEKNQLENI